MFPRVLMAACGALLLVACSSPNGGRQSCELSTPPSNAQVQETHGVTLLIYPSTVPPQYSGCRSVWFSNGQLFARVRVEDGDVRSVYIQAPEKTPVVCEFEISGQLKIGDARRCLPQERWLLN